MLSSHLLVDHQHTVQLLHKVPINKVDMVAMVLQLEIQLHHMEDMLLTPKQM